MSAKTAIAVLSSKSLRWSSPLLFNDLFDVQREWKHHSDDELAEASLKLLLEHIDAGTVPNNEHARKLVEQVRAQGETFDRSRFSLVHTFFARLSAAHRLKGTPEEFAAVWRERVECMRILCLSDDPAIPSMWGRYADSNSGVVIRFESSDERDSVTLGAEPVIYSDEPPQLPPAEVWMRTILERDGDHDWPTYLREYEFVKQTQWQDEREYRIIGFKRDDETQPFSDRRFFVEDVSEIILGPRIAWDDEASIRMLWKLGYSHSKLLRAKADMETRKIVFEDAGDPDLRMISLIEGSLQRVYRLAREKGYVPNDPENRQD
jgi:hypothetical protein